MSINKHFGCKSSKSNKHRPDKLRKKYTTDFQITKVNFYSVYQPVSNFSQTFYFSFESSLEF